MSIVWFEKFKKAEDLVKKILAEIPEARGDDNVLVATYWNVQGLGLDDKQLKFVRKLAPVETITRARRKVHEMGLYLPNKHKYEQRKLLEEEVRKYI